MADTPELPNTKAKNILSQPPLTAPLYEGTGRISRAWAIWFRDIYQRIAYKGGNAIDDTLDGLEKVAIQVAENVEDISENSQDIETNKEGIETNRQDIETNTENIAVNTGNILNLEHRTFGEARPDPYDENAGYQAGDTIVFPAEDPQNYYRALEQIPAPAGTFDPLLWERVDLLSLSGGDNQEVLNLEHRTYGAVRPSAYDEAAGYLAGAMVVYPGSDPQTYYQAQVDLPAPAGTFDPSVWKPFNLLNMVNFDLYLSMTAVKGCHVAFTGRSTDGAATLLYRYNLLEVQRIGTGRYRGQVIQNRLYGKNIFDKANPIISFKFLPSARTASFYLDYTTDVHALRFNVWVYELISVIPDGSQTSGNQMIRVPYDPVQADDVVYFTLLTDISDGQLPPP